MGPNWTETLMRSPVKSSLNHFPLPFSKRLIFNVLRYFSACSLFAHSSINENNEHQDDQIWNEMPEMTELKFCQLVLFSYLFLPVRINHKFLDAQKTMTLPSLRVRMSPFSFVPVFNELTSHVHVTCKTLRTTEHKERNAKWGLFLFRSDSHLHKYGI